jgi:hypothetical protein
MTLRLAAMIAVLLLPITLAFGACEDDDAPAIPASPTATIPLSLTQPIDPRTAFPGSFPPDVAARESGLYILDIETGTLRGISTEPGYVTGFATWGEGADVLLFDTPSETYQMDMAGNVGIVSSPTPSVTQEPYVSGDGGWQAVRGDGGGVLVIPAGPLPESLRRVYGLYLWSPVGHMLASWGGPCGGGLEVLDAETMQQVPMPSEVQDSAVAISWTSDGETIGVAVREDDAGIVLAPLDLTSARRVMSLGPITTIGLPLPTGFSASGRYLLLTKLGGYDCSN